MEQFFFFKLISFIYLQQLFEYRMFQTSCLEGMFIVSKINSKEKLFSKERNSIPDFQKNYILLVL